MSLALFSLPRSQQRQWLERRLSRAVLPAAKRMGDGFRLPGREGHATPAAVLIPVVNRIDGLTLLLTERSANLPDHPGQISFPGGRAEPGDVSLADTALREAREEVGLLAEQVAILGELAPYETVTGYLVTPFVGWVEPPLALKLDPLEVADVFEVPLAFLLDPVNHRRNFRMVGELRVDYWAIPYGERDIWGATAAMLRLFIHKLRDS
jgi:8-oxo-dGTP pyrophosphatase MutT (NUDIX family)